MYTVPGQRFSMRTLDLTTLESVGCYIQLESPHLLCARLHTPGQPVLGMPLASGDLNLLTDPHLPKSISLGRLRSGISGSTSSLVE